MTVEIAALFVGSLSAATSILNEIRRKRDSAADRGLLTALYGLDMSVALHGISDVALAERMRGAMTNSHARTVFSDIQIKRLLSELVLTTVVEDQDSAAASIRVLVTTRTQFLLQGQVSDDDSEYFAHGLVSLMDQYCKQLLDAALEISPDAVIKMQSLNVAKRTQAILLRVSEQADAVARILAPDNLQEREGFYSEYKKICAEVHGAIQPPDFETNQRIPLKDLYVGPAIFKLADDEIDSQLTIDELLDSLDRTVVLGDPGGGKSTLSNYVATMCCEGNNSPIPYHLTLREFAPFADSLSILQFIERQLPSRYQIEPPEGAVADTLLAGEAVVIFDGLDELIDPSKRRAITAAVETFGIRYPLTRILVTSRRVGYEQARLDPAIFQLFKIDGFSRSHVAEYVQKWFSSQTGYSDEEAHRLSAQFMTQSNTVADLSSNPLMLSLMCIIFRGESFIPRNRPAVYEKCANLLFEKWDGHRQIEVPLRARDHVDAAMKHIAHLYLVSGASDRGITRVDLVREMTSYLFPRAMETLEAAERAAEEFVDFCAGRAWVFSDAGTTATGEPIFTFTHRTFMEYFAAVHLVRTCDTPEKLARTLLPRIAREEWDVVAQLAVQQCDKSHDQGTERALRAILYDPRKRTPENRGRILDFVARCCQFAVFSPALMREISAACLDYFLTAKVQSDGRFDFLHPWLALQSSVVDEQVSLAVRAQNDLFLEVLSNPDDPRITNATYLSFLGLIRRFNGRMHVERNRSSEWDDMFTGLVARGLDPIEETLESNPEFWIYLILGAVVPPSEALAAMRASGLSFSEMYFKTPALEKQDIADHSLVAILHSVVSRNESWMRVADLDILIHVASEFLEDYSNVTSVTIPESYSPEEEFGYWQPVIPSPEFMRDKELPQTLVDFILISATAIFELQRAEGPRSEIRIGSESGSSLVTVLESMKPLASATALDFATRWLAGDTNFFNSVVENVNAV
ncbi:NACHT domain-containing protein [Salinibacterium sp. NYA9b]